MNSSWSRNVVWPYRTALAQVMACCLTAPSHYISQWLFITEGRNHVLGSVPLRLTNESNTHRLKYHGTVNQILFSLISETLCTLPPTIDAPNNHRGNRCLLRIIALFSVKYFAWAFWHLWSDRWLNMKVSLTLFTILSTIWISMNNSVFPYTAK